MVRERPSRAQSVSTGQGEAQDHRQPAVRTVFRADAATDRLEVATHDPQADTHVGPPLPVAALVGLRPGAPRHVELEYEASLAWRHGQERDHMANRGSSRRET